MQPFNRDAFIEGVSHAHLRMQIFLSGFGLIVSSGATGNCQRALGERDSWLYAPGFTDVPEAWVSLYSNYRLALAQAVNVTQPLADICAAGGGILSDETDRAIIDTLDATQNSLYSILTQAQAMP